jgi:hypothetical protein
MENQNLPRVSRIKSVTPVSYLESFDMMSRFLAAEKVKQVSLDFAGDAFLTSASQIWDDLRLSCNSISEEHKLPREPVASWKDENGVSNMPQIPETMQTPEKSSVSSGDDSSKNKTSTKKSTKKEKKEAKKAKKSVKKAKKEAKKAKKAAKKRTSDAAV